MTDLPDRFWRRVDKTTDGCWLWRTPSPDGYGRFQMAWVRKRAHRWTWEAQHGPVPNGLVLDHRCRQRACVRPDHLRAVTSAENTHAPGSLAVAKLHAAKTSCPAGHRYDRVVSGKRRCSTCLARQKRESKQRRKVAA